jgi:hypothetical protein
MKLLRTPHLMRPQPVISKWFTPMVLPEREYLLTGKDADRTWLRESDGRIETEKSRHPIHQIGLPLTSQQACEGCDSPMKQDNVGSSPSFTCGGGMQAVTA